MTDTNRPFESTAPYYARFRPSYPVEILAHVVERFHLDGRGRLLDLGCGTGQLTLPLAPQFADSTGMDPEPEMLAEAENLASELGITNIRWLQGGSNDLRSSGPWRLVTMGRSFH